MDADGLTDIVYDRQQVVSGQTRRAGESLVCTQGSQNGTRHPGTPLGLKMATECSDSMTLQDVSADGRADLMLVVGGRMQLHLNTGKGFGSWHGNR